MDVSPCTHTHTHTQDVHNVQRQQTSLSPTSGHQRAQQRAPGDTKQLRPTATISSGTREPQHRPCLTLASHVSFRRDSEHTPTVGDMVVSCGDLVADEDKAPDCLLECRMNSSESKSRTWSRLTPEALPLLLTLRALSDRREPPCGPAKTVTAAKCAAQTPPPNTEWSHNSKSSSGSLVKAANNVILSS